MDKRKTKLEKSALIVASLTSFMGPFMVSSVNVALPAIQSDYQMNAVQLSWVATAYMLALAVALVPSGKAADIYGRKKIFAIGLVVNIIATALAPLAQTAIIFIFLRAVQGAGAALYVATGMAILSSVFPPDKRGKAIGIYVSAVYIGLSAGPWIGGMLTQHFGWRTVFFASVPMGLFCLLLTLFYLQGEWRGEPGQKLDLFASLLYGTGIICLVFGGTRLLSGTGVVLFFSGICLGYFFVRHQLSAKFPVFDFKLFVGNRNFTYSSLAALLHYSATYAVTFLLSLYLQFIKGLSPQAAGAILMMQPVMMALLSPVAGKLSDRIDPRLLATVGMIMTCGGIFAFSLLQQETDLFVIALNLIFLGTGFALFSSPNMSAIMGAVDRRYFGLASGAVATMRLLGQMSSMALATVVLGIIIGPVAISADTGDMLLSSIRVVLLCCTVMSLLGVYFSWYRGKKENSQDTEIKQ